MLVLITYDVNTETAAGRKRLRKVAKQCTNYGRRVQNSVFEGDIGEANLKKLKKELSQVIDKETDSVIIYKFNSLNYSKREVIGIEKNTQDIIL